LNRACPDVPAPVVADSAVLLGPAWIGAGTVLAQGAVVRSHEATVSIDNHSAVLENSSVVGTGAHPVAIGQRTVFGHRCQVIGARIGNLCEVGNGSILMPGAVLGDGCILGEGTLIGPGTVVPEQAVVVGRPGHVIRAATAADRERVARLRDYAVEVVADGVGVVGVDDVEQHRLALGVDLDQHRSRGQPGQQAGDGHAELGALADRDYHDAGAFDRAQTHHPQGDVPGAPEDIGEEAADEEREGGDAAGQ